MTILTAIALLNQCVSALQGHTDAGQNVFTPRSWPTWENDYPCILTQVLSDIKQSQGRNSIAFTATSTIRIICRAAGATGDDDVGSSEAEDAAWALAREVEANIIGNPAIGPVQQFVSVNSTPHISSDGDKSIADVAVDIAMEYYMDASDFYTMTGPVLSEQTLATSQTDFTDNTRLNPGADITSS